MTTFIYILSVAAILAVASVLTMGLWNMAKAGSPNRSQSLMRMRVLLQAVAIFVLMALLWSSSR
ncbi:MAG: twin transmembrane helix small protein [Pseudomonadota bacterium]